MREIFEKNKTIVMDELNSVHYAKKGRSSEILNLSGRVR
jgi:hypothetical protein